MTLVVVSKCLKINGTYSYFHFKGVFDGHQIKEIKVKVTGEYLFIKGQKYILYLKYLGHQGGVLKSQLLSVKVI